MTTRHYSTKNFFRQMPNALLARYFEGQGLFGDLDFSAMSETKADELFAAWLDLVEAQRKPMDAEFRGIFELSCEKGCRALSTRHSGNCRQTPMHGPHSSQPFPASPTTTTGPWSRIWITRSVGKGPPVSTTRTPCPTGANASTWATTPRRLTTPASSNYFHRSEGRGNNCVVEPFRRGELDYFFTYPGDYSQQSIEWVDGKFGRRPHNPAFEVVYVYSQREGTLDLNFRGSNKAIEPLQGLFSTVILGLPELPPDPKDQRVYDLNPLRRRDFQFVYDPGSGIEDVVVKNLRLSSRVIEGDRITLEADTRQDRYGVHALLDKLGKSLPLRLYNATQVELGASVVVDSDKPAKTLTISITHPDSCSLKYDELDLKLRDLLAASGIEPKEPADVADVLDAADQ